MYKNSTRAVGRNEVACTKKKKENGTLQVVWGKERHQCVRESVGKICVSCRCTLSSSGRYREGDIKSKRKTGPSNAVALGGKGEVEQMEPMSNG
ncbi:insertion element IS1664 protein [Anopheles sinensis]|uniref:Insertion element IS1664 protein n=1 Tax=Anopheles sinensis TaxID=74873 RepID=A0A084VFU3_ANOSI|nr:insertion element IS1664 protein [Anopheles sinensis]